MVIYHYFFALLIHPLTDLLRKFKTFFNLFTSVPHFLSVSVFFQTKCVRCFLGEHLVLSTSPLSEPTAPLESHTSLSRFQPRPTLHAPITIENPVTHENVQPSDMFLCTSPRLHSPASAQLSDTFLHGNAHGTSTCGTRTDQTCDVNGDCCTLHPFHTRDQTTFSTCIPRPHCDATPHTITHTNTHHHTQRETQTERDRQRQTTHTMTNENLRIFSSFVEISKKSQQRTCIPCWLFPSVGPSENSVRAHTPCRDIPQTHTHNQTNTDIQTHQLHLLPNTHQHCTWEEFWYFTSAKTSNYPTTVKS